MIWIIYPKLLKHFFLAQLIPGLTIGSSSGWLLCPLDILPSLREHVFIFFEHLPTFQHDNMLYIFYPHPRINFLQRAQPEILTNVPLCVCLWNVVSEVQGPGDGSLLQSQEQCWSRSRRHGVEGTIKGVNVYKEVRAVPGTQYCYYITACNINSPRSHQRVLLTTTIAVGLGADIWVTCYDIKASRD